MTHQEQYDWVFKRSAMDAVLREYAAFFRVSTYIEDTRTLFLLAMCAMIDLAQSGCESHLVNTELSDSSLWPNPWDLDRLQAEDKRYFSHAYSPGNSGSLHAEEGYRRMLMVLRDAPFI